MKLISDLKAVPTKSTFVTDVGVTLYQNEFYMAMHIPINGVNCIAMRTSDDGVQFGEPKVILRPDPKRIGATRGLETPSPPQPPIPGVFDFWSMICMGYDIMPERKDHESCGILAVAKDPMGEWSFDDIVFSSIKSRQQPVWDGTKIEGGLSEFGLIYAGNRIALAVFATNSYRPKPCIYGALSSAPWLMRSWLMTPDPIIEGEGKYWASQPSLSIIDDLPVCVYVEGAPERIRVARGNVTLEDWEVGEILVQPDATMDRCVGPCLVPLESGQGRLYFTAVSNDNKLWRTMTALVDLSPSA